MKSKPHRRTIHHAIASTRFFAISMIISVVIMCGTIGVGIALIIEEYRETRGLRNSGVIIQGTVINREVSSDSESDTYAITYRFHAATSQDPVVRQFTKTQTVSSDLYHAIETGQPVSIIYMSDNPAISRLKGTENFRWRMIFIGPILSVIPLFFAIGSTTSFLKARKLDINGQITSGSIIDVRMKTGIFRRKYYYVIYQFGDHGKAVQEVKASVYRSLRIGDAVEVKYLASDPNCSRMLLSQEQKLSASGRMNRMEPSDFKPATLRQAAPVEPDAMCFSHSIFEVLLLSAAIIVLSELVVVGLLFAMRHSGDITLSKDVMIQVVAFITLLSILAGYIYYRIQKSERLYIGEHYVTLMKRGKIRWQYALAEIDRARVEYRSSGEDNEYEPVLVLKDGKRITFPSGINAPEHASKRKEKPGKFLPFALLEERGILIDPENLNKLKGDGWLARGVALFLIAVVFGIALILLSLAFNLLYR